jgi:hypothetical protein
MTEPPNTFRQFSWRTSVKPTDFNGMPWESWTEWCWTWDLGWPRRESFAYDGCPIVIWYLGVGSLCRMRANGYAGRLTESGQ